MTMGFCMVQKTSILTPLKLSFSLVFFITVTDAETRPDIERLTPFRRPLHLFGQRHGVGYSGRVFLSQHGGIMI